MTNEQVSIIKRMEEVWQLGVVPRRFGPRAMLQRFALRLLGPLIAQQREFNAATVQLSYQLAAQAQSTSTTPDTLVQAALSAVLAQAISTQNSVSLLQNDLHTLQDTVHGLDTAAPYHADLTAKLDALAASVATMQHKLTEHMQVFDQIRERIGDIDQIEARVHQLAYVHHRVSALSDTLKLLDDAAVEGDHMQADLAEQLALLMVRLDDAQAGATHA
jgi:chromosome segregation ATPase